MHGHDGLGVLVHEVAQRLGRLGVREVPVVAAHARLEERGVGARGEHALVVVGLEREDAHAKERVCGLGREHPGVGAVPQRVVVGLEAEAHRVADVVACGEQPDVHAGKVELVYTAADGTDIPIVYAAISDPEAAGLTGLSNVTGTSDALNTAFILDMMLTANPDIKTVGLLYSNSEANSATPIAEAKAYLQEKQIDFVEKTGNTSGEIVEAAASMVGRVDAVFTPTDNVVMAAEVTVAETLNEAGIPHYTGADSFVAAGAFATCGVNYTELGTYTADMAMDILLGGAVPEFHVMDGGIITVNTETGATLGIDYSVFSSMANTVVEVKTGE